MYYYCFFSDSDIKRPKSRQVKHEDDLLNSVPDHDLVMVPTDPEKQFCKRSQHQVGRLFCCFFNQATFIKLLFFKLTILRLKIL